MKFNLKSFDNWPMESKEKLPNLFMRRCLSIVAYLDVVILVSAFHRRAYPTFYNFIQVHMCIFRSALLNLVIKPYAISYSGVNKRRTIKIKNT